MPGMDGLEAMRRIRAHPTRGRGHVIIALTALAMANDSERYLTAGERLFKQAHGVDGVRQAIEAQLQRNVA